MALVAIRVRPDRFPAVARFYLRRDEAILRALDRGESYTDVAREFGLSRRQVLRIGKGDRHKF